MLNSIFLGCGKTGIQSLFVLTKRELAPILSSKMQRYLFKQILSDSKKKLILISGPRQVGKTTLSRGLSNNFEYYNWDATDDRPKILKKSWDRSRDLVIFDELHKMHKFKSWLKGVYDKDGIHPGIIVTGSARLDIAKKVGDSLAGRFFPFRLHPIDLWELDQLGEFNSKRYDQLLTCSGFPEPFFEGDESFYSRWSKTHLDIILRQDLLDLESVRNISGIETLISILQTRVGSCVSYSSLSRDLERDPKTIKRWLDLLENLFVLFKVTPFHKNIARSKLKEPKYYFYDIARVRGDEGQKLENLVALALQKQLHYLSDSKGIFGQLYFLRTREGKEIDFMISWEKQEYQPHFIEVKLSDNTLSPNFKHFAAFFKGPTKKPRITQLVKNLEREKLYPSGEVVTSVIDWLRKMPLLTK